MSNYNRVILMGNLTRDVELRTIPNTNNQVANLGIAVNRKYKTAQGEQREEVTFVDCEAFGRTAEVMGQYLAKGKPVHIEGRLKLDQWQDQQGNNRSKLKVIVENFQFVSGGEDRQQQAPASSGYSGGGRQPQPEYDAPPQVSQDDIPF